MKCPLVPRGRPRSLPSGAVAAMPVMGEFNHGFKCSFLWKAGLARDESLPAPPSAFPSTPLEKYPGDREKLCEFAQRGCPLPLPPPPPACCLY